eukprot:725133-Pyramimonas_sp.AAC.1
MWKVQHLKALAPQAKGELAFLLTRCEQSLSWPHQWLHIWYELLRKGSNLKAGDERPIGSIPLPMRLWGRIRQPTMAEWSSKKAAFWDAA